MLLVHYRVVRSLRTAEQAEEWKKHPRTQIDLRKSIKNVLKHIYDDVEEVPYVATYRKQSCGELLCLAADELPEWTTLDDYK